MSTSLQSVTVYAAGVFQRFSQMDFCWVTTCVKYTEMEVHVQTITSIVASRRLTLNENKRPSRAALDEGSTNINVLGSDDREEENR